MPTLPDLVRVAFDDPRAPRRGERVVVATSGGRDSMALLHLLRFCDALPTLEVVLAHLDHAMRPGSRADAAWVRGVARAWSLDGRVERLAAPASGEAQARTLRYAMLERVRREVDGVAVLTAHHAGDQAETVLFRVARGTGLRGLQGIRPHREPAVWRPLLGATPAAVAEYAASVGLRWREDPTNDDRAYARNALRHEILPLLDTAVAAGASAHLAALAGRAREEEAAWASLFPTLLEGLDPRQEGEGLSVDRATLLGHPTGLRARLLRALARRLGAPLTSTTTRLAVTFVAEGRSGTALTLDRGLRLARELDRVVLRPAADEESSGDRCLSIAAPVAGAGEVVLNGRRWTVNWGGRGHGDRHGMAFDPAALRFPLELRSRKPGDRLHMPYGHKKLKKLLLEARIPSHLRDGIPVLADADHEVLWIPGVARSIDASVADHRSPFHIGCTDADTD